MRLQFYSLLLVALAFAQASAATIPLDRKSASASAAAGKAGARDAVPDAVLGREKRRGGLVIGDAGFCTKGTSFCCVSNGHNLMGVSSGTTCTFNADEGHVSKLQGCEDVDGGKSVCCVAGGICEGMSKLAAPIVFA